MDLLVSGQQDLDIQVLRRDPLGVTHLSYDVQAQGRH
jgi:hypothetical protein